MRAALSPSSRFGYTLSMAVRMMCFQGLMDTFVMFPSLWMMSTAPSSAPMELAPVRPTLALSILSLRSSRTKSVSFRGSGSSSRPAYSERILAIS